MAAPVAHIFCALALLQSGALKVKSEKDFIIGTSFPDIRYLAKLSRKDTHTHPITWQQVKNAKTDFQAGMLFHALVDDSRIKQIEIVGEPHMPYVPVMKTYILKLFEDILLYDRVKNWSVILSYFDDILPEELAYVTEDQAREWHKFIQRYCSKKVSANHMQYIIDTTPHFSIKMPKLPAVINKAYLALVFYRYNQKKLLQIVDSYYSNIVRNVILHDPSAEPAQAKRAARPSLLAILGAN